MMTPLSRLVWEAVPTLQIVQFSWRFGTVLCVATAPLVALAAAVVPSGFAWRRLALGQVLWLALVIWLYVTLSLAWPLSAQAGERGMDRLQRDVPEYRPRWAKAEVETTLARFTGADGADEKVVFAQDHGAVEIETWKPGHLAFRITLSTPSTMLVRQYYFPGWEAQVDGAPVQVQASEPDGVVQVSLPAGAHRLALRLRPTVQERLGQLFSGLACCVAMALLVRQRRRSEHTA